MVKVERRCRPRIQHAFKNGILIIKRTIWKKRGKASHQDVFVLPHCFKDLSFLNTGKMVHIFHLKVNNDGEGKNASNQHFLLFLCCLFKDFFPSGIKSRDYFGEESLLKTETKQYTGSVLRTVSTVYKRTVPKPDIASKLW